MQELRAVVGLWVVILIASPGVTFADDVGASFVPDAAGQTTNFSDAPSGLAQSIAGATAGGLSATQLKRTFSGFKPEVRRATRGGRDAQIYARLSPSVVVIFTKEGTGSGVLISEDGTVLTNAHVVGKNEAVTIAFKPSQEGGAITKSDLLIAKTVKIDEVTDLALVKLESIPGGVKPVVLGDMKDVAVGDDVHAIGHPLGQNWTYTKGYVSQIRSEYSWRGSSEGSVTHKARVIQTQTPINPGNSGGPLLSDAGTLVGVNSFGKTNAQGINFAVSIDDVRHFLSTNANVTKKSECRPKMGEAKDALIGTVKGKLTPVDIDCSGRASAHYFVPDDASKPVALIVRLADGGQMVVYDYKRSGKWEKSFIFEKNGTKPIAIGYHDNGQATPTRIERVKRDS